MVKAGKPGNVVEPLDEEASVTASSPKARLVEIPHAISVEQLADLLQVSAIDVIKRLMSNGIMANINQTIDYESAAMVAAAFSYEAHLKPQTVRKRHQFLVLSPRR